MLSYSLTRKLSIAFSYLVLAILIFTCLFPIGWMVSTAFKPFEALFDMPPQWIPKNPTLSTFQHVFFGDWKGPSHFPRFFLNNVVLSAGTALLCTALGTLAGYGFSRYPFRGSNALLLAILGTQMFPGIVLLIPIYNQFSKWGLLDTYHGQILIYTVFNLPFPIWLLKGFYDTVPRELEDAALIDGCDRLNALRKVVLPIIVPGLIAVGVFTFLRAWDVFLLNLILTSKIEMKNLPVGLYITYFGQFYLNWGAMMASSVIITLPVVVVFILFQRYIVQGIAAGAVKG